MPADVFNPNVLGCSQSICDLNAAALWAFIGQINIANAPNSSYLPSNNLNSEVSEGVKTTSCKPWGVDARANSAAAVLTTDFVQRGNVEEVNNVSILSMFVRSG